MNSLLAWVLTRTWLLRVIAVAIAGLLVGWGVVKDGEQKSQVAETVLLLLTGAATLAIEQKKSKDAKKAQRDIGAKPDGWFGPQSRATIPGGPFNPNAEVRKAERPGA